MTDQARSDAVALHTLIAENESWLIDRILSYAKRLKDRGVELGMFLGLMKYYRQSYMDLVHRETSDRERSRRTALILERFFDRIEIGLVTAWYAPGQNEQLAERDSAFLEYTARRRNGEVFPTMGKIARLKNADGSHLGIVSVLQDISARRQAEAAQRKAERLQGVLELAGAVSHDMNQPLIAITGYAELMLMTCARKDPLRPKLQKRVDLTATMGAITKKLMHVTRYETKPYLDQRIIDIDKASLRE